MVEREECFTGQDKNDDNSSGRVSIFFPSDLLANENDSDGVLIGWQKSVKNESEENERNRELREVQSDESCRYLVCIQSSFDFCKFGCLIRS